VSDGEQDVSGSNASGFGRLVPQTTGRPVRSEIPSASCVPKATLAPIGGKINCVTQAQEMLQDMGISFDLPVDEIIQNIPPKRLAEFTDCCDSTGVYRELVDYCQAKGQDVVCVTSGSEAHALRNAQFNKLAFRLFGVANVHAITNRSEADTDAMAGIIADKNTRLVYLDGGGQEGLAENFVGTKAHAAMMRRYITGEAYDKESETWVPDPTFTVGGSSAGAAGMPGKGTMIVDWNNECSAPVMGDGLGMLEHVIIETHLHREGKIPRLPRLQLAVEKCPNCMGIGLDEETGVLIRDGVATVIGNQQVWTMTPEQVQERKDRITQGETIEHVYPSYVKGQTFELGEYARLTVPPGQRSALAAVAR